MYQLTFNDTYKKKEKKSIKLSCFFIAFLILTMVILIGYTSQGSVPQEYKVVKIEKGDTLWGIVQKYNTANEDPRKLISEIKKINNLETVLLHPGQTIKIP